MGQRTESKPKRVLFVCSGNTCRSPMAAGLATKILGDVGAFESAGISPSDSRANNNAIDVMHAMGIDISNHYPRRVFSVNLNDFDFIIAMDSNVNLRLKSLLPDGTDKILSWDVDDPWGGDIEDYRRCAEIIKNKLSNLRKVLQETNSHRSCLGAGDEGQA